MLLGDFHNYVEARQKHGARADKYLRLLARSDPLADAVVAAFSELPAGKGRRMLDVALDQGVAAVPDAPAALHDLFAQLDDVPFWVEWAELDRGGAVYLRSGIFGMVLLALYSLPVAYSSPAGNKPLVFSGKLVQRAPRRVAESGHFVLATCRPGGLRRFAEGFKITVKVRLMHAQVRRLLWRSAQWDATRWGVPINQCYLAGTNLAFSFGLLDGLRRFGFRLSHDEREALLQLWRYSGYLSGIEEELLCATEAEAARLSDLIVTTEGAPDADSHALVQALMAIPVFPKLDYQRWQTDVYYGISRALIGGQSADALGYPKTPWRFLVPALRPLVFAGDVVGRHLPGGRAWATALGAKTWEWMVEQHLGGMRPGFRPPEQLDSRPTRRSRDDK